MYRFYNHWPIYTHFCLSIYVWVLLPHRPTHPVIIDLPPSLLWDVSHSSTLTYSSATTTAFHQIYTSLSSFSTFSKRVFCFTISSRFSHPPPPSASPPAFSFLSLSGTITPSVVAAKREQMLELLPTQCTKPSTAGLSIPSLLLLHGRKETSDTSTRSYTPLHLPPPAGKGGSVHAQLHVLLSILVKSE